MSWLRRILSRKLRRRLRKKMVSVGRMKYRSIEVGKVD